MSSSAYYTMALDCPWGLWTRPNVQWCESYQCSWIATRSNTWSNLSYLLCAYFMHVRSKERKTLWMFVPATILVGLTSFAFHASVSRTFQIFDFLGMFSFCALGVTLNLARDFVFPVEHVRKMYVMVLGVCCVGIPIVEVVLDLPIQFTVVLLVLAQIVQEIRLRYFGRYKRHPQLKPAYDKFKTSLMYLGCALVCSVADVTRVWCVPDSVVQGHAIWHILSAIGLYQLFLFYEQLDFDNLGMGLAL